VPYLNSPRKGCPRGMNICVWTHLGLMKWKTTSKKKKNDRQPQKIMEDNLKKNGRQPQIKNGRCPHIKNGRRPQKN
jgi:hypothetical protein